MAIRRHYVNNAPIPTLTAGIGTGNTTCVPTTVVGFPAAFPWTAVIDAGTATAEVVLVTATVGSTLTITRAYAGTAAQSHALGAVFAHVAIDADYDEANAHVTSSSGVHGVAGALVGTNDVQTLTNKTLTAPVLSAATGSLASPTITGTSSGTNATLSGTLGVTGVATLGVVNATSVATTGVATVSGVIAPKSFTNEAARDAAITAPTNSMLVYLSAPTGAGTGPGFFQYTNSVWSQVKRPRIGARATTSATQTVAATTLTTLTNNGGAWSGTEDSGGFISVTPATPIIIPAGLGGLYMVGMHYIQVLLSTGRNFAEMRINGTGLGRFNYTNDGVVDGSFPLNLNAGDTIGAQVFSTTAGNANVGSQVFCYRVSD